MKKTTIFLILLCLSLFSYSKTNEPKGKRILSGKVLDKETGEALAGVRIEIKGADSFCYTDLNGNYFITSEIKPGTEITVNMIGYKPLTVTGSEVTTETELQLIPR